MDEFALQRYYGEATEAVRNCDLGRYLAVLLRLAKSRGISVPERNAAGFTALLLADEATRQEAFQFDEQLPPTWAQLLAPFQQPPVSLCLFRDACVVAWADGLLDPEEQEILGQIARGLKLDSQDASRILGWVRQQEEARLGFLQLLAPEASQS